MSSCSRSQSGSVREGERSITRSLIRDHRTVFSVRTMCQVLMVHVSGFYAWLKEPLSQRAQEDVRQTELIRQAWSDSGKVYGYPLAGRCLATQTQAPGHDPFRPGIAVHQPRVAVVPRPAQSGRQPLVVCKQTTAGST